MTTAAMNARAATTMREMVAIAGLPRSVIRLPGNGSRRTHDALRRGKVAVRVTLENQAAFGNHLVHHDISIGKGKRFGLHLAVECKSNDGYLALQAREGSYRNSALPLPSLVPKRSNATPGHTMSLRSLR